MTDVFTKRLNQTLQKQNITQRQLSELTGITEQSISRYANGSRTPKTPELIKIADALDVSIDYLLGRINITVEDIVTQLGIWSNDMDKDIASCLQYHAAKLVIKETYEKLKEIWRKRNG